MTHPCLKQVYVLETQWTDCPDDVKQDVRKLWQYKEFGNDHYYYRWDINSEEEMLAEDEEYILEYDKSDDSAYPKCEALKAFLASKGIRKCLIHYWW